MKSFNITYNDEVDKTNIYHVDYPEYNSYYELRNYLSMLVQGISFDQKVTEIYIKIEEELNGS